MMRRREVIALLGGATATWPLAGRAQNVGMRRVIVLMGTADDAEAKDRAVALQEGLQKLRWNVGRDLQINYLFAAGNAERLFAYANEAVASKPDILLAQTRKHYRFHQFRSRDRRQMAPDAQGYCPRCRERRISQDGKIGRAQD